MSTNSTTGSLTTTGSVVLSKDVKHNLTQFQISGTYGTVTFVFEASVDGTNYNPVSAVRVDTGAVVTGSVAPADNSTYLYNVDSAGYSKVRLRSTAVGSGTLAVYAQSGAYLGRTPPNVSNGNTFSGTTLSGTTTVTGDVVSQSQVLSANGAVTIKAGVVYITKGTACSATLADPTATTDDGKTLIVISTTAAAHTLSNAAGSGFNAGGASTDVGTFGGAIGDGIVITAYQGKWIIISKTNVTLG